MNIPSQSSEFLQISSTTTACINTLNQISMPSLQVSLSQNFAFSIAFYSSPFYTIEYPLYLIVFRCGCVAGSGSWLGPAEPWIAGTSLWSGSQSLSQGSAIILSLPLSLYSSPFFRPQQWLHLRPLQNSRGKRHVAKIWPQALPSAHVLYPLSLLGRWGFLLFIF
ncbi:hypothetical protein AMTRI_Chr11g155790 [Amborella trichopoda]